MRKWLIRKLGGMLWEDIHPIDQVAILQRKADMTRDRQMMDIVSHDRFWGKSLAETLLQNEKDKD